MIQKLLCWLGHHGLWVEHEDGLRTCVFCPRVWREY